MEQLTILEASIIEQKTDLLNRDFSVLRNSFQELVYGAAESDIEEDLRSAETVKLNDAEGGLLEGRDHDLNAADGIGIGNLCLDRVSRARRYSHKLLDGSIVLCDAIEPELAFISWVDNSIVLNGLLLVDKAGATESSSEVFDNGFTTDSIDTTKMNLDSEGTGRLQADPESLTLYYFVSRCLNMQDKVR